MPPAAIGYGTGYDEKRNMAQAIVSYRNIRKKVDCIEAQRVMYVFQQLQRRLLLLGSDLFYYHS